MMPKDFEDELIRLICCGLPGLDLCAGPNCACYEGNGKPIAKEIWALMHKYDFVPPSAAPGSPE